MDAHILLNLLNELGKPRILSLFRKEFNKFNKTGAQEIYSIYHMSLKLFCNRILWHTKVILVHRIRISEILPWDRKSYLTHAISPRTSSNDMM